MNIKDKVKQALQNENPEKVTMELEGIPNGVVYSKKIRSDGVTVTYQYSEKQKAIMELVHGVDIEENTDNFIEEGLGDILDGEDIEGDDDDDDET